MMWRRRRRLAAASTSPTLSLPLARWFCAAAQHWRGGIRRPTRPQTQERECRFAALCGAHFRALFARAFRHSAGSGCLAWIHGLAEGSIEWMELARLQIDRWKLRSVQGVAAV